jgi:hypothetical protein
MTYPLTESVPNTKLALIIVLSNPVNNEEVTGHGGVVQCKTGTRAWTGTLGIPESIFMFIVDKLFIIVAVLYTVIECLSRK